MADDFEVPVPEIGRVSVFSGTPNALRVQPLTDYEQRKLRRAIEVRKVAASFMAHGNAQAVANHLGTSLNYVKCMLRDPHVRAILRSQTAEMLDAAAITPQRLLVQLWEKFLSASPNKPGAANLAKMIMQLMNIGSEAPGHTQPASTPEEAVEVLYTIRESPSEVEALEDDDEG